MFSFEIQIVVPRDGSTVKKGRYIVTWKVEVVRHVLPRVHPI